VRSEADGFRRRRRLRPRSPKADSGFHPHRRLPDFSSLFPGSPLPLSKGRISFF